MNILEELKLSKKQNNDERYEYLCQKFNTIDYAIKLEKYTIKLLRENKILKDNWNKLKEWVDKCYDYYTNEKAYIGGRLCFIDMKDKMLELEQEREDVSE